MKSLVESLFDKDLVERDLPVDDTTVLSYINEKYDDIAKHGVHVEVDTLPGPPGHTYIIHFESSTLPYRDNVMYEVYDMKISVTLYEHRVEIELYCVYGLNKGLIWSIKRVDIWGSGENRHVNELKIEPYVYDKNKQNPNELYKIIDSYFEIFEKLNNYRLFDGSDDVADLSNGQLINKVYDKVKKIWPKDAPKLKR